MFMKRFIKCLIIFSLTATLLCFLFVLFINIYMINYSKKYIYKTPEELPEKYTLIIPGARVYSDNVSLVVRDRLDAASACIKNNRAEKILISGDQGRKDYDEVNRMRIYLQDIYNIDENIIFMDHAGFSTYETMYRARDIFCVKDAVIVTQAFHTVRSVYIARKLGLDAVALEAPELTPFGKRIHASWTVRESLARVKSFFLVLFNAKPTYLGEKIPVTGNAKASWDEL